MSPSTGSSPVWRSASVPSSPGKRLARVGSGGGYQIIVRPESFARTAAAFLARKLRALGTHEPISIALSGGSTPGPVYELLARSPLPPWDRISVHFVDERVVARTDPESNYRLVRETLIERTTIPDTRVYPMMPASLSDEARGEVVDDEGLDELARSYEETLPSRFDLILLGLGEDGHTASLFPGSPALEEHRRRVVPTLGPASPRQRLTITPPVLAAARLTVVLATGPAKAEAVGRALRRGPAAEVPGRLARSGIWVIGADALPA